MSFVTVQRGAAKHRAIVTEDGLEVQPRNMSPRYVTVDPKVIAPKLRDAGYVVREFDRLMESKPGWARALEVELLGDRLWLGGDYKPTFKALFDHAGKRAVSIYPGIMRCSCCNDFVGPAIWRCRHTDHAGLHELLNDPVGLFDRLVGTQREVHNRLEKLHGVEINKRMWGRFFQTCAPRVGQWSRNAMIVHRYPIDMWGLAQGLTEIKRVQGQRIAEAILSDEGHPEAMRGQVPPQLVEKMARAHAYAQFN